MRSRAVIRMMGPDDLRGIFLLGKNAGNLRGIRSPAWNEDDLAEALTGGFDFSFVAIEKKAIAGFIIGYRIDPLEGGPILSIPWFTIADRRDARVIRLQLFIAMGNSLSDSGTERVVVSYDAERRDMIDFFEKKGFTIANTILVMESSVPSMIKRTSKQ